MDKELINKIFHKNKYIQILKATQELEEQNKICNQRNISIKSNTSYAHNYKILKELEELNLVMVNREQREHIYNTTVKWEQIKDLKVNDIIW